MSVREYIGARYVPVFADPAEWDATKTYEPLTVVLYQGNSYTSRQSVPANIPITNETYWAQTGNYNAQVEQYRQEVNAFNNRITQNTTDIDTLESIIPAASFNSTNTVEAAINAEEQARTNADTQIRTDFAAADSQIRTDFAAADSQIRTDFAAADSQIRTDFAAADTEISNIIPASAFSDTNTVKNYIDNQAKTYLKSTQSNIMYGSIVAKMPQWNGINVNGSTTADKATGLQGACIGENGAYVLSSYGGTNMQNLVWIRKYINGTFTTTNGLQLYHSNCLAYDGTYYYDAMLETISGGTSNSIAIMDRNFNIVRIIPNTASYQPAYDKISQTLYLIPLDTDGNQIKIYDYNTDTITDTGKYLNVDPDTFGVSQGVAIYGEHIVYPVGYGDGKRCGVVVYNMNSGNVERNFMIITDMYGDATGELEDVDFDIDGNLYVFSAPINSEMGHVAIAIRVPLYTNTPIILSGNNFVTLRTSLVVIMSSNFNTYWPENNSPLEMVSLADAVYTYHNSNKVGKEGFILFSTDVWHSGPIDSYVGSILTNGHTVHGGFNFRECNIDFRDNITFAEQTMGAESGRNANMILRSSKLYFLGITAAVNNNKRLADRDAGVCGLQFTSSNNTIHGGPAPATLPFCTTY